MKKNTENKKSSVSVTKKPRIKVTEKVEQKKEIIQKQVDQTVEQNQSIPHRKKDIRKVIVFVSIGLLYCVWFMWLYIYDMWIFSSLLYIFWIYGLLHIFSMDYQKVPFNSYVLFASLLTLVERFFLTMIGKSDLHIYLSLLVVNAGIVTILYMLHSEIQTRIDFSIFRYSFVWTYMFVIIITLCYALFILGNYKTFPYSCEMLAQKTSSVVNTFTIGDFIQTTSGVQLVTTGEQKYTGWIQSVNEYKFLLIDQVVRDGKELNQWLCEYTLWIIQQKFTDSTFQFSLILLTFLLLSPFVTVVIYILSFLVYVFISLLYKLWIYTIEKQNIEQDIIV